MPAFVMKNRTIGSFQLRGKIFLLYGISMFLVLIAVSVGFWVFNSTLQAFQKDVTLRQTNAINVEALESDFKKQVQEWKDTLLRGKKPEALNKYWSNFQKRESEVRGEAERLSHNIPDPETAQLVAQFLSAHKTMGEAYRRAFEKFKAHDFDSAVGDAAVAGMDRAPTDLLSKAKDILVSQASARAMETKDAMTVSIVLLLAAMAVGGMLFLVVIQRNITSPLRALMRPLEDIAGGNFAIEVPGRDRKDEIGQIASALGAMAEKVSTTIAEVKASGREVTNASAEISTSTTDLSQRTEEQAASLEETSAAMEELSATVKKNAENAQQANTSANSTRDVAERGGQVVAKAVDAMAKIEESSRKISDIIGVIDEIARQTNLLALNAAVEAARAGEAGRGFAVVASEVRSLAQRSSQAAKDIKDLITNSNGQVKDGVELVNKAGASLTEIVDSIKKVAEIVGDIANASTEQATGIEQINKALSQMDEVTQQNSALVEENAATAKTLEHQAKTMDEQVAFFQIGDAGEVQYAPRAKEPAERPAPKPRATARAPKAPAASKQQPVAALKHFAAGNSGGPVRRMQTAVATAMNADADWKEF
jgi:methyl-accepting chemotaxis protein